MIAFRALSALATAPRHTTREERCELCARRIGDNHRHVVEVGKRGVLCACPECIILFGRPDSTGRYRTVPSRVLRDPTFPMTSERWAQLGMPVGLAFCFRDSASGRTMLCYPGPAGLVDAEFSDHAWRALADATPLAAALEEDVEALLVYGTRGAQGMTCHLVPISTAYELVTRLRRAWHGFTGGSEAERALATFWQELAEREGRS